MKGQSTLTNETGAEGTGSAAVAEAQSPEDKWADPGIPIGNAPPLPRWPLVLATLAWLGWVVFLAVMAVERVRTNPV